jgi:probable rRNA maturation factor
MPGAQISFHCLLPVAALRNRGKLKALLKRLFRTERKSVNGLSIIFCSDSYLLKINKKYLKRHYYTDTLSFTLSRPLEPILGEIYISYDRIRENAKTFGSSIKKELHRVIFHSALHLCGYSDQTPAGRNNMSKKEDYWLSLYFG